MDIRRTIMIYSIAAGLLVAGIVFYQVWYGSTHPTPTDDEAKSVMDTRIQTISTQKPFAYQITRFYRAADTALTGSVWCAVIDPPMPINPTPSNPTSSAEHFLIQFKLSGVWETYQFGNPNLDKAYWSRYGCGEW
jgi:hypothetical protein